METLRALRRRTTLRRAVLLLRVTRLVDRRVDLLVDLLEVRLAAIFSLGFIY